MRVKTMTGKGDKQRPTDKNKYDTNYDKIFGAKVNKDTQQLSIDTLMDAISIIEDVDISSENKTTGNTFK